MIKISDYPHLSDKKNLLTGISSTLPIEIIYAAGRTVVDLNNIFITSVDSPAVLKASDGFTPRTVCSWTRGVLAAAILLKLPECVVVTEGDCAHAVPMLEILSANGISAAPFEYPLNRDASKLKSEIARFMARYKVTAENCEAVKAKFDATRSLLKKIDELTYKQLKVSGFENHLHLIGASDFNSDPGRFHETASEFLEQARKRDSKSVSLRLGYVGIPPIFNNFYDFIEGFGSRIIYNETQRQFSRIDGIGSDIVQSYYDYTYPYMFSLRAADIKKAIKERELDAIIHYVQSFCFHQIEDRMLRNELGDFPVLTLEGDRPGPLNENDKLKIESFIATVEKRKRPRGHRKTAALKAPEAGGSKKAGIDIGSRSVKIAYFDGAAWSFKIFDTMDFIKKYMDPKDPDARRAAFERSVIGRPADEPGEIEYFSTGYGRYKAKIFNAAPYSEIQCHAAGACYMTGLKNFTLIDIGGQDMKVIEVEDSEIKGFSMNDRCAAGSGRYLENMARILKVGLDELSACHEDPAPLSITCATFGETEVICRLMEGVDIKNILAGVNYTVYARTEPMLDERRSRSGTLVVTSGIALNKAFLKILEKNSGFKKITVPESPQWIGAIGACVYGGNFKNSVSG